MSFTHPLALLATEVGTSTSPEIMMTPELVRGIPADFLFTQDLYNGLDNGQVLMLQRFLNGDTQTQVNSTGPGSPGNETTYFGNATQNAVERFQVLYRSVILDPLGFSSPTGIIGARSRSVLNQILDNLRNNLPANTNIFIGRAVQNNGTSTAATLDNNLLFQSVGTGTSSLNFGTSTASSTASTTPLRIETGSIPSATVGTAYVGVIEATGGTDSYSWSVLYGSLPNGVTGRGIACAVSPCKSPLILSGTPTSAGSYTFIIRLSSGGEYITKEMVINIQDRAQTTTTQTTNNSNNQIFTYNPSTSTETSSSSTASSSDSNIGLALGIVGAAVAVGAVSKIASTASSAGMPSFGGRIVYVQYCTCSTFILLYVFDTRKVTLPLLYIPGYSKLLKDYNIWIPGPLVLGGYTYGGPPCMIYAGTSCVSVGQPVGIIDAIRGVGTSLE